MVQGRQPKIGIVDYGMGNLRSVYNAFSFLGADAMLLETADHFNEVSHLVIPGVGAFAQAMDNLEKKEFIHPIHSFVNSGKPVLGICLGMQLMAGCGFEPYARQGLNLIGGNVRRLENISERIPHVGWNSISLTQEHYLFEDIKKDADFYFVHSYFFDTDHQENILANTNYGKTFASVVHADNVVGTQFHPEKSQRNGLKILENFSKRI